MCTNVLCYSCPLQSLCSKCPLLKYGCDSQAGHHSTKSGSVLCWPVPRQGTIACLSSHSCSPSAGSHARDSTAVVTHQRGKLSHFLTSVGGTSHQFQQQKTVGSFPSAQAHPASLQLVWTGPSGPYQPIFIEALSTEADPLSSALQPLHYSPNRCRLCNQYVQKISCLIPNKAEMKPSPQRKRGSISWHTWEIKNQALESDCQLQ